MLHQGHVGDVLQRVGQAEPLLREVSGEGEGEAEPTLRVVTSGEV